MQSMKKQVYYLAPNKYYYNYAIEGTCQLSLAFSKGLYTSAYTIKQARLQMQHTLAKYNCVRYYDIDIDINDIELVKNYD